MTKLPPRWRREPLENCPICKGKGEINWRLYSKTKPEEWICVGRAKPIPPKKKGKLLMAESAESIERREVWMEHAATWDGPCACVTQRRVDFTQLKRTAAQMQRIIHNEKPPEHSLDDSIDDLFRQ